MPLHMTKIAFGASSAESLREWLEGHTGEARLTTRYLPKRRAEMDGGSLYWIHQRLIIGRSPLLGFDQREDARWWIRLAPQLIPVSPIPRRPHQGWRYLSEADAPADLTGDELASDAMPGRLVSELARLGLV